ncbi:hypothetical protein [Flavobacterium sp. ABG]|uniref:hypothetical protein n=1 Tax=Flavobacterium sp. ABG TaxID=1423322 RepID=UPI0006497A60|nr:hypothetical protein [Flavobacterium sp. ABG]KLT70511.1 hypothetical protein AB674_07535 [Flavobacterium sp. ABG]
MKKITYLVIIIFSITLLFYLGNKFAPGSYPYAEKYELQYKFDTVKSAILRFKEKNKDYIVPKVSIENQGSWDLKDESKSETSNWYRFYFYYKKENKVIYTLISSTGENSTEFSFISINNGLNIGNWKDINNDLDFFENKKEKKLFEDRILIGIKKELDIQANGQ